MHIKYETTIEKIGPSVTEFLSSEKILILFGENAPREIEDYCLSIKINQVSGSINIEDTLQIGNSKYRITAVGEAVKRNLSTLGHITLKFNGSKIAELPGTLYLEASPIKQINIGDVIRIYES